LPLVPHGRAPRAAPRGLSAERVVEALAPILSPERKRRIEEVLDRRLASVTVVLENLYDPHNGAAVLRTCEGLGLHHVHVIEGSEPFFFSRKVSQSAHKWLAVHLYPTIEDCVAVLRGAGFRLYGAVPPMRGTGARGAPLEVLRPTALLFGNEHAGLSARALAACDGWLSIPMHGFSESLNLSVSVALALHPLVSRRREELGRPGDLPAAARTQLRAAYYALSTPHAADLVLRHLGRYPPC
jgi:tRNA (guanosine-2'-O-)-methyltransferase